MNIDPAVVRTHIEAIKAKYPDLFADSEAWELVLESETDLDAALTELVLDERESAAFSGALATQVADMQVRQARFDKRGLVARELIQRLLESAGVTKRILPLATLSITKGRERVVISDADSVPDILCRVKREPDLAKIKQHLESGATVNWAAIVQGEPGLSVRTK